MYGMSMLYKLCNGYVTLLQISVANELRVVVMMLMMSGSGYDGHHYFFSTVLVRTTYRQLDPLAQ